MKLRRARSISSVGLCISLCKYRRIHQDWLTLPNSVVLEAGIYGSHIIWRIRYRKVIREAKATGRTVDEVLEPEGNGLDVEKGDAARQEPAQDEASGTIRTNKDD